MKSPGKTAQVMQKYCHVGFEYGSHDCCTFAQEMIESYHNIEVNFPHEWDGKMSTMKEIFQSYGVRTLKGFIEALAADNHWPSVGLNFLQPFDLVLISVGNRFALAVFDGERVLSVGKESVSIFSDYDSVFVSAWRPVCDS